MPKMLTLGIHLLLINMKNILNINSKIKPFSKKITTEGDKSLSIRWALLSSQAIGKVNSLQFIEIRGCSQYIGLLKKTWYKSKII